MSAFGLFLISILGLGQQMAIPRTQIISRTGWGARPSKMVEHFKGPAPFVVIHHSYLPSACDTTANCAAAMRSMQDFHQLERGWNDIGYSFAIGGDGMIYTGRGFNVVGAHAPKYNDRSVGICLIGDWRTELPPLAMLQAAKDLITFGVAKGYIATEYKLLGHRQVRDTDCPGGRLFDEISGWPNFAPEISQPPTTPTTPAQQQIEDKLTASFAAYAPTYTNGVSSTASPTLPPTPITIISSTMLATTTPPTTPTTPTPTTPTTTTTTLIPTTTPTTTTFKITENEIE